MKRNRLITLSIVAAGCLSLAGSSFGQTGITNGSRSRTDAGTTTSQNTDTTASGPQTAFGETAGNTQTARATKVEDNDTSGRSIRHKHSSTKSHHRQNKKSKDSDESQNEKSQGGSSDNG